jgi:hypothetical protein
MNGHQHDLARYVVCIDGQTGELLASIRIRGGLRTKPIIKILLFGLMLTSTTQIGCTRHDEASASAKAEAHNRPPTATEAFHLQSECVEMGKQVLENNLAYGMEKLDMEQGKMPKYDVTQLAHYNAKDNHCYVELSSHDTGDPMKRAMQEVYDGQTGELVASCTIKNPPLGERFGMIFRPEAGDGLAMKRTPAH